MKISLIVKNQSSDKLNGTLDAKGFRNIDSEGKIYFDGIVIFKSHD